MPAAYGPASMRVESYQQATQTTNGLRLHDLQNHGYSVFPVLPNDLNTAWTSEVEKESWPSRHMQKAHVGAGGRSCKMQTRQQKVSAAALALGENERNDPFTQLWLPHQDTGIFAVGSNAKGSMF